MFQKLINKLFNYDVVQMLQRANMKLEAEKEVLQADKTRLEDTLKLALSIKDDYRIQRDAALARVTSLEEACRQSKSQ